MTLGDPGYPAALLEIEDPPLMLYMLGPPAARAQAAVKTGDLPGHGRQPQPDAARRKQRPAVCARSWPAPGCCVVSGLALGIDGAAHEGALLARRTAGTIAVVGTGLDRVYPKQHLRTGAPHRRSRA